MLGLRRRGVDITIVLDSVEQAQAVAAKSRAAQLAIPVLIEIDSDGHRAGVRPSDELSTLPGSRLTIGWERF